MVALIWFDPVGKRRRAAPPPSVGSTSTGVAIDAGALAVGDAGVAPADAPPPPLIDAPPPAPPLYTVSEALDDVAASSLTFIGTGEWFGNDTIHACAYRNDRVLVVNVYCTRRETPALGLLVLSPAKGRLYIYVEADAAISTLTRAGYQTFRVDAQPPLDGAPVSLDMTYDELDAWEERRYHSNQPACWYEQGHGDCSDGLASQRDTWGESVKPFLAAPPDSWYSLTKQLHARAARDLRAK